MRPVKEIRLNGTYKNQIAAYDEIFPLKKYKFYDHEVYGPNSYNCMFAKYGEDCLEQVSLKYGNLSRWPTRDEKSFLFDKNKHKVNWSYEEDVVEVGSTDFCTANTEACVADPLNGKGRYIFDNGFPSLRPCCFNKKNKLLIDTCAFLEKHDIPYFVYWGTLLGILRNNQATPWDEDHDLYIPGEDHKKFHKLIKQENISNYVYCGRTDTVNYSEKNRIHTDIYYAQYL
jgi:hypothetical protein